MPLHPDFQRILESFREEYGGEGERRFWAWVRSHGYDETKSMAWNQRRRGEATFEFEYVANVQPVERNGVHLAKIYAIDATMNRNRWGVTPRALGEALNRLKNVPILGPPELGHRSTKTVGHVVDWEANGAVYVTAEITDPDAWRRIQKGEWRYVSPKVIAGRVFETPEGEWLDEIDWIHFAFVENPAFPQAGVVDTFEGCSFWASFEAAYTGHYLKKGKGFEREGYGKASKDAEWDFNSADYDVDQLRKACAWYDREHPDVKASYKLPHHRPDGTLVWRGVAAAMAALLGARGGVDIPAEDRRNVYEHLARHYREFDEEPPEYHAQTVTSRGHESDILKEKIKGVEKEMGEESQKPELRETPETVNANVNVDANVEERLKLLEAENAVLKAKIADLEEQRRLSKIAEVLQVREEAGLCVDREAEVKKLRNFSDEVLEQMKEDAERVASLAAANRTPKAKYTAEQMHRRIEEVREALLGYRKSGGGR